eukprot:362582-Pyramimonas_sp.AAC.1
MVWTYRELPPVDGAGLARREHFSSGQARPLAPDLGQRRSPRPIANVLTRSFAPPATSCPVAFSTAATFDHVPVQLQLEVQGPTSNWTDAATPRPRGPGLRSLPSGLSNGGFDPAGSTARASGNWPRRAYFVGRL